MSSYKNFVKPGTPALQSTRVLDQLREPIRCLHYSHNTESVYLHWARFFIPRGTILRWSCLAEENTAHPLGAQ